MPLSLNNTPSNAWKRFQGFRVLFLGPPCPPILQPAAVCSAEHEHLAVIFRFACFNSSACHGCSDLSGIRYDSCSLSVLSPLVFSAIVRLSFGVLAKFIYLAVAVAVSFPLPCSLLTESLQHQPSFR